MNKRSVWKRLLSVGLVLAMLLSPMLTIVTSALSAIDNATGGKLFEDVTGQYGTADTTGKFNDGVTANKDPDGFYWVFVCFGGKTVSELHEESGSSLDLTAFAATDEALALAASLDASHEAFYRDLEETGIEFSGKYSYTLWSDAVAIRIRYRDVKTVEAMEGVTAVRFSEHYDQPEAITENNANVWGTGIYKTEGIDYDGAGLVVAVLDTGLDRSHKAFLTMPKDASKLALTKDRVQDLIWNGNPSVGMLRNDSTSTVDDVYYNAKVPFAYDYADKDPVVYPSYSVHGTHVAGIIAGNLGDEAADPITDQDGNPILGKDGEPLTFRGVAPEAQLVICKVFTDNEDSDSLGGAETVDILAALEDCVKLGVDVINMSLGSSAGFSEGNDELMIGVYKSIRESGISLVVAASNDYSSAYGSNTGTNTTDHPDSATVGSPSTFAEALSVASISGQKSQYMLGSDGSVVFFNEVSDGNGNKKEFVKEVLAAAGKGEKDTVTLPFVAVRLYGQISGYTGLDVEGKVVLVERGGGNMTFEEKVRIAKSKGALAVVIYNNVSGNINMAIGGVKDIPVCAITMDASKLLLATVDGKQEGTITFSTSQLGGPFMSDFSSWGPTPSLNLKPEITAHGGDITSAVPGGWDTLSGTSMAAPNMAGAFTLVLQYLKERFPEMSKNDRVTMANRLIMSTPVIAYNEFGAPYSPRKQGAGLATIKNAIETDAYLYVNGIDKTKIELGDDKNKTGVYDLKFQLKNIGTAAKTYALSAIVMTETVTEDKSGTRTVAEHAYLLNDLCTLTYFVGDREITDGKVTVGAGEDLALTVRVTLGEGARKYLDDNFENGMYVEGFVCLSDADEAGVDLSIPFLGFYGDWYAQPMFDLSAFEEADIQQDDSIPDDEKPQAAVCATVPLGSYYNGRYILPLGSYLYAIPDWMSKTMYADEDKVSLSIYDSTNHRTAYQLYSIYTGLLRGAKYMDVKVTDEVTGEILYEKRETNIRKAYSGGSSSAVAAHVITELSPKALGLANNRKYRFEMSGVMDRVLGEGDYPEKREDDSFSFTFYVDTEAPELMDYRVRFDPYKEGKETKYRVYLDLDVYDNHYAQSATLCYLNNDEFELELLTGDMIPIESSRGGVSTVSLEITDYYESDIDLYIQIDDYALNTRSYRLTNWKTLAEAVTYPEEVEITDGEKLTLDIGEVKSLGVKTLPANAAVTNLTWVSSNEKVVRVKNGELYAVGSGKATVTVYAAPNTATQNKDSIEVTVTNEDCGKTIKLKSLKLGLIRNSKGAMVDPTGLVDVHPNTVYVLDVTADPWYYPGELDIRFTSSAPEIATVDEKTGVVKTLREGVAYITATQYADGKATAFSVTARLNVGPEFVVESGYLRGYYGLGGKVTIPKSLNVYYIYEEAFKDNDNITELEISSPCMEIQRGAFDSMTALKRVILPQSVTYVASDAFRNCTSLERVDLRSRAVAFGKRVFAGCSSLKYINNVVVTDKSVDTKVASILELTEEQFTRTSPQISTLGSEAFRNCTALEYADLTQLRVSGDRVFVGCTALKTVDLSEHTVIGNGMFTDCRSLRTLNFTDTDVFSLGAATVPLAGCRVSEITFQNGASGNYFRDTDGCLYTDSSRTTLVFAPQTLTSFTSPDSLRVILAGAFAGNSSLRSLSLGSVREIGDYAFANTGLNATAENPLVIPASVTKMGKGAFYSCAALRGVDVRAEIDELPERTFSLCSSLASVKLSDSIERLGDHAFSYAAFETLDLTGTSVTELGDYVFAYTYRLKTVKLPALTKVGYGTFWHAQNEATAKAYPLTSVSFAEGTTAIGSGTFGSGFASLTNVSLPDSVKQNVTAIGANTFYGCTALTKLNLGALTSVGDKAFYGCTALRNLDTSALQVVGSGAFENCGRLTFDLSHVTSIGSRAFVGTAITSADLSALETVGAEAFRGAKLATVTGLGSLTSVGDYAFAETKLSGEMTLPATLLAERGAVGVGAFAGTAITAFRAAAVVDGAAYLVQDGVLFSRLPNGALQLEAYPGGATAERYTLPSGVARIQDAAFRSVSSLQTVTLNAELTSVGDKAFYLSDVTAYVFTGLTAPSLESRVPTLADTDATLQTIFSRVFDTDSTNGKNDEKFYANFGDYAVKVLYSDLTDVDTLGLTVSYPANATGFDGRIWQLFFEESEKTEILPEPNTTAAIEALSKLPTAEAIRAILNETDKDAARELLDGYKATAGAARAAYAKVVNADQKKFLTDAEKLFAAETAVREVRLALGEEVKIASLAVKTSPSKLTYTAGERFDATGMVLTVIYDDGSEEDVTEGFVLPEAPLTEGQQTVTFQYRGIEKEISLTVNADPSQKPSGGDSTTETNTSEVGSDVGTGEAPEAGCASSLSVGAMLTVQLCGAALVPMLRRRSED